MTEYYQQIELLNTNCENYTLTVVDGENIGSKAIWVNKSITYTQGINSEFWNNHSDKLSKISNSGIYDIGDCRIYAELLGNQKKIVICGAGHVSIPMIQIGKMLDCHVTCVEDRPFFANNAKQAGADKVICESFEKALLELKSDIDTYFIIVTRGHRWDQECLRVIANKPHAYIGLMGSKRRVRIIKDRLIEEGLSKDILESVYTPIGLDIKAETPAEIAVAVMAEIISVKNQKSRNMGFPQDILYSILGYLEYEKIKDTPKVLATIVMRKGSAPREVGTKMIILKDGKGIGTIGGGCVEADVIRKAREMILEEEPQAVLYRVELTEDEAADEGMVCGGILDVFMELIL